MAFRMPSMARLETAIAWATPFSLDVVEKRRPPPDCSVTSMYLEASDPWIFAEAGRKKAW